MTETVTAKSKDSDTDKAALTGLAMVTVGAALLRGFGGGLLVAGLCIYIPAVVEMIRG